MNIKDIVELAKAGYKPNEVKELMEMATQQNQNESEQNHDESDIDEISKLNDRIAELEKESEQNHEESEQNHDESNIDEISKLNDRIAELENVLKVAQEHNRRSGENQHEEIVPEDHLKEVMRNFY